MDAMPAPMPEPCVAIHLVDDDAAFRRSLAFLLEPMGWPLHSHASAPDFLAALPQHLASGVAGCLLLDIRMPGMSGLELQQELQRRQCPWPIIFLTGHADVELAVQAMKHGAFDLLEKPFRNQRLLDAVSAACRRLRQDLQVARGEHQARARLQRLSPREAEVARLLAQGLANKLVARELGISEKTVHIHRQRVMEKAEVGSAAELTRLMLQADRGGLD